MLKQIKSIVFILGLIINVAFFNSCTKSTLQKNIDDTEEKILITENLELSNEGNEISENIVEVNNISNIDIFFNIPKTPDEFENDPNFTFREIIREAPHPPTPKREVFVENDVILLYYPDHNYPNYTHSKEKGVFLYGIIQKETTTYFLGKYIGMKRDDIIQDYPNYYHYTDEEIAWSENDIYIIFFLEDDIVNRILFGFEL